ncbi:probable enoyl-CoA hydratase [Condylostylus longicornis]|uniref:probable enoyl-CoA hydratase n=1 Tax=Condylostylus longicornis TaxID=2530218 RepID=UPI00244E1F17|nr:probable enoyl-CoA hydratase [Condylostylus longicornis]
MMLRNTLKILSQKIKLPNASESVRNLHKATAVFAKKPAGEKSSDVKDSNENKEEASQPTPPPLILVEADGPITLIGINRPDHRNAVNADTAHALCEAFSNFENNEESTIAVLYGVGGSFCSGYDIHELVSGDNISTDLLMLQEGSVGPTRRHLKKPVICAINGYCVANGLELALMCDLRVMEESATLGFFNRRFGVPIIDGGTARLPSMIGFSRALDLILTGRQINASEAHQMGLVNRVVATGTALGQAVNLAGSIAKFPQAALNHDRNSLYSATFESHNFNQAIQNEIMYTSKEILEEMEIGIKKFSEGKIRGTGTENVKEKSMADWEKEEIAKEEETKNKDKNN